MCQLTITDPIIDIILFHLLIHQHRQHPIERFPGKPRLGFHSSGARIRGDSHTTSFCVKKHKKIIQRMYREGYFNLD